MAEVQLVGSYGSPFVVRVLMALKHKGIEYEFIEEDLRNKSPLLLKLNPIHKKVPVLVHNGKPVTESMIIVEYIEEAWAGGPSFMPKDPYERAQARFWSSFINDKLNVALFKTCASQGEEREKNKEEAAQLLKFLEDQLEGKKFFGGDRIGFVDVANNFLAHWFPVIEKIVGLELITEAQFPNLCKWAHEFVSDSFVKETLPPKENLEAHFRAVFKA